MLGVIAEFARSRGCKARLVGLDLNELSIKEVAAESLKFEEISPVQANALTLPFDDNAFDYAICSLFTHHLTDEQIPVALGEMSRVARRGIVVIDLERSVTAWLLYQLFCLAYRISRLVHQDGSLSIRKGFTCREMIEIGNGADLGNILVQKHAPYREVLSTFIVEKLL